MLVSRRSMVGKADVWAVGALVYAMAIGDPSPAELATSPRSQLVSVVRHQTGSEELSLVAHRALDPDPYSRSSVHQVRVRCIAGAGFAAKTCRGTRLLCI